MRARTRTPDAEAAPPPVDDVARLDGTGCAVPPSEGFIATLLATSAELARGGELEEVPLRDIVAASEGHPAEGVQVAASPFDLLLQLCLVHGSGGRALVFEPTDPSLAVVASARGMEVAGEPLGKDFLLFPEAAATAAWRHRPDIAFVSSPNDPTGNSQLVAAVQALCEAVPGLVVVDERHGGFGGISASLLLERFANLAVVRTLSPAYARAGAGLGVCLADPGVVERLQDLRLSETLPPLALAAASVALRYEDEARSMIDEVVAERDRLVDELGRMPALDVYPSETSFVLLRAPVEASRLAAALLERRVRVRDVSDRPGLDGCLRVNTGRPDETDRFVGALAESLVEVAV